MVLDLRWFSDTEQGGARHVSLALFLQWLQEQLVVETYFCQAETTNEILDIYPMGI